MKHVIKIAIICIIACSCDKEVVAPDKDEESRLLSSAKIQSAYVNDNQLLSFFNQDELPYVVKANIRMSDGGEVLKVIDRDTFEMEITRSHYKCEEGFEYDFKQDYLLKNSERFERKSLFFRPFAQFYGHKYDFAGYELDFSDGLVIRNKENDAVLKGDIINHSLQTSEFKNEDFHYYLTQETENCGFAFWKWNGKYFYEVPLKSLF